MLPARPSARAGHLRGDPRHFPDRRAGAAPRSHTEATWPRSTYGVLSPLQTRLSPSKRTRASSAPSGARLAERGPSSPLPARPPPACPFSFSRLFFFLFHLHH